IELLLCGTLSVESIKGSLNATVKIYPNPVSNTLYISTNQQIESVAIYTLLGREIVFEYRSNQIDVSSFKSGIYLLKIETDKGSVAKKIIIN
uniref:T9SS type A sorting domain-containing protein n=1 Tax=Seonamhaeicola sp. TaxID=1912245 RepID=UPI0035626A7B